MAILTIVAISYKYVLKWVLSYLGIHIFEDHVQSGFKTLQNIIYLHRKIAKHFFFLTTISFLNKWNIFLAKIDRKFKMNMKINFFRVIFAGLL